jgi:hypothetical protein
MLSSKLDSFAKAWASWLAKRRSAGPGTIVVCFFCAVAWLALAILTHNVSDGIVSGIWLFVGVIQFERRGFLMLVEAHGPDVPKNEAEPVATANGPAGPWLISNVRQNMATEAQLHFLKQIDALLLSLRDQLSTSEMKEVRHLIDHGEPAEGLRTLAWIIEEERKEVAPEVRRSVCELCCGLIEEEDMPESFRSHFSK